jgi:hypothetical protein
MTPTSNKFAHTKIVLAGLLTTGSSVRDTAEAVYTFPYPLGHPQRNVAIMRYLRQLGVPTGDDGLIFDDLRLLFATVFPGEAAPGHRGVSTFPIDMDYDQDNCDYEALVAGAVDLDQGVSLDEDESDE